MNDDERKPCPLIYIEWEDSVSVNSGWETAQSIAQWAADDECLICQAGYLIAETDGYIVLASQYNPHQGSEERFSSLHKVPKAWIRRRIDLGPLTSSSSTV